MSDEILKTEESSAEVKANESNSEVPFGMDDLASSSTVSSDSVATENPNNSEVNQPEEAAAKPNKSCLLYTSDAADE